MFKDYYLIMGVSYGATLEEIEKAFTDTNKETVNGTVSKDLYEKQEAYDILSKPDIKVMYDEELKLYNSSSNHENYKIQNTILADTIIASQIKNSEKAKAPTDYSSKLGKGCLWIIAFAFVMMLHMCYSSIMKQKARNAAKNRYSHIIPQQQVKSTPHQTIFSNRHFSDC